MIDGVHPRGDREQHLRGADVAGGLLAADVLLARLQGHPQSWSPSLVLRDPDDPAGEIALELIARREERGVRPAVAERHPEALRVADGDVGAPLAGRHEQREREQIGGYSYQRPGGMGRVAQRAVVTDGTVGGRVLKQRADHPWRERKPRRLPYPDLDPEIGRG